MIFESELIKIVEDYNKLRKDLEKRLEEIWPLAMETELVIGLGTLPTISEELDSKDGVGISYYSDRYYDDIHKVTFPFCYFDPTISLSVVRNLMADTAIRRREEKRKREEADAKIKEEQERAREIKALEQRRKEYEKLKKEFGDE